MTGTPSQRMPRSLQRRAPAAGSWLAVCLLQGSGWKDPLFQLFVTALGLPLPAWVPSLAFAVAFTMPFWLVVSWLTRRGWRLTIWSSP